jgi:hypothetical protein
MIVSFLLVNCSEPIIQRKTQIHSLQGLFQIYFPGFIFDNHSSLAIEHRRHRQPGFFGVRQLLFPRRRNAAKLSAAGMRQMFTERNRQMRSITLVVLEVFLSLSICGCLAPFIGMERETQEQQAITREQRQLDSQETDIDRQEQQMEQQLEQLKKQQQP